MSYDALLMLSGGKDSCSIALNLFKEKQNILLFINDVGFVSKTAKSNIKKIKKITGFHSVQVNEYQDFHKALVDNYFQNPKLRMEKDLCHACTELTEYTAQLEAKKRGIKVIYNGHTSEQMGWIPKFKLKDVKIVNGIEWRIPYFKNYDLKQIKKDLKFYNIEWNPTKTNCIPIEALIQEEVRRSNVNPFGKELDELVSNGSISPEDALKIRTFCRGSHKRLHEGGYFQINKISPLHLKQITRLNKRNI